ncbi:MAG: S9 family peptidase, partial [Actinobacteria bacterium]|nr:S9 family peptidase [Actinomycetota bacterium]
MAFSDDPYLWLEDVTGDDALAWVREKNEVTIQALAGERFDATVAGVREILDTDARIPYARRRGQFLYNFWRDAEHIRGVWRRTTMDEYRTDEPAWDVLLDLDALAADEGENWVWGGAQVLRPDQLRALVTLSRGGADATVVREFDLDSRTFRAAEDGGFTLPEAKTDIGWIDADTVFVGTDFGPGSLTESGYPRITKRWHRGTPLADAETVYEGESRDISISAWHDRTPGFERDFVQRSTDFYNSETYVLDGTAVTRIPTPTDASTSVHENWLLVRTMTEWTYDGVTHPAGALLAADFDEFMSGTASLTVLFTPDEHTSLHQYAWTENHLLLVTLQDVRTRLHVLTPRARFAYLEGRKTRTTEWDTTTVDGLSELASTEIIGTDAEENGDEFFLGSSGYLTPATLLVGTVGGALEVLKQAPAFFDADGMTVEQFFAESDDGTAIPYFVVRRGDAGPGPTLLYGYGGFEISMTPGYSGA